MFNHPKCGGKHATVAEAKTCESQGQVAFDFQPTYKSRVIHRDSTPSPEQIDYLQRLKAPTHVLAWARRANRGLVGDLIEHVKETKGMDSTPATPRQRVSDKCKVPLEMILKLGDGRYAAQIDSTTAITFYRVSRPKSGKYRGLIKVQTQHSEGYMDFLTIDPSDNYLKMFDRRGEENFLYVVVDPIGAMLKYAEHKDHCCVCGKQLTDARSRHYGIGPECEKAHEEIIQQVDEIRGVFNPLIHT